MATTDACVRSCEQVAAQLQGLSSLNAALAQLGCLRPDQCPAPIPGPSPSHSLHDELHLPLHCSVVSRLQDLVTAMELAAAATPDAGNSEL